jgi:hypothetical protein
LACPEAPRLPEVIRLALTELERIDRDLVSYGKQLARAEANLNYDMVATYTAYLDRLLDDRLKLTKVPA